MSFLWRKRCFGRTWLRTFFYKGTASPVNKSPCMWPLVSRHGEVLLLTSLTYEAWLVHAVARTSWKILESSQYCMSASNSHVPAAFSSKQNHAKSSLGACLHQLRHEETKSKRTHRDNLACLFAAHTGHYVTLPPCLCFSCFAPSPHCSTSTLPHARSSSHPTRSAAHFLLASNVFHWFSLPDCQLCSLAPSAVDFFFLHFLSVLFNTHCPDQFLDKLKKVSSQLSFIG